MRAFFVIGGKNSCLGFPKKTDNLAALSVGFLLSVAFYSLPLSLHDSTDKSLSRKDE